MGWVHSLKVCKTSVVGSCCNQLPAVCVQVPTENENTLKITVLKAATPRSRGKEFCTMKLADSVWGDTVPEVAASHRSWQEPWSSNLPAAAFTSLMFKELPLAVCFVCLFVF